MPVMRTYRCPDCGGVFEFLHMSRNEPPPDNCELCQSSMQAVPELPKVNIGGSNISKAVDMTYAAAEESLGVTDLKDNLREGDIAAKVPNNPVTQVAAQIGHNFWGGGGGVLGAAPDLIAAAKQTAGPSIDALSSIQTRHRI